MKIYWFIIYRSNGSFLHFKDLVNQAASTPYYQAIIDMAMY